MFRSHLTTTHSGAGSGVWTGSFLSRHAICRGSRTARDVGIPVACIPMWEFTNLKLDWVYVTDLMLCPTLFTFELLSDWRQRFGFAWDVVHVPWPVDTRRFRYRQRRRCDRFLFVNGGGGCQGVRADGSRAGYRRKGMEVLFEAARLLQPIPFIVYTQIAPVTPAPANVELRPPPMDNARLYDDGDVCVQPSHWEGLGLQLLECQAAGLPLVTIDAPPMNEFEPMRTVPSRQKELLLGEGDHVITSHRIAPEDLAAELESVYRTDIREASERRGYSSSGAIPGTSRCRYSGAPSLVRSRSDAHGHRRGQSRSIATYCRNVPSSSVANGRCFNGHGDMRPGPCALERAGW